MGIFATSNQTYGGLNNASQILLGWVSRPAICQYETFDAGNIWARFYVNKLLQILIQARQIILSLLVLFDQCLLLLQ